MFSWILFHLFEKTTCVAETSDSFEILKANSDETVGPVTWKSVSDLDTKKEFIRLWMYTKILLFSLDSDWSSLKIFSSMSVGVF